jgi:hypothetical protein
VSTGIWTGKGPGPCGAGAFTGAMVGVVKSVLGRWRFREPDIVVLNGVGRLCVESQKFGLGQA